MATLPLPSLSEAELIGRAAVATCLGAAVGLERSLRYKDAGLRTLSLVALGSCAFATAGYSVLSLPGPDQPHTDPTRIAAQVVSGIGFLGAGAIFVHGGRRIRGLTTAADIWVAAASGLLCGVGLLWTATAVTAMGLIVVVGFQPIVTTIRKRQAKVGHLRREDDTLDSP